MTARRVLLLAFLASLAAGARAQAPAKAKADDAARLYRVAIADFRRLLDVAEGELAELPGIAESLATAGFAGPEWAAAVAKAAVAIDGFGQAARLDRCDFGASREAFDCGYDDERLVLLQLAQLTAARGRAHATAGKTATALHDAATLLRHAQHLGEQPSSFAVHLAGQWELQAMALVDLCLGAEPIGPEARRGVAKELDRHAERRADRGRRFAMVDAEIQRRFAASLAGDGAAGDDPEQRILRDGAEGVRAALLRRVVEWTAPLRSAADDELPKAIAVVSSAVAAARRDAAPAAVRRRLPQLSGQAAIDAVGTMFALLLTPPVQEFVTDELAGRTALQALRRRLVDLAAKDPPR